MPTEPVTYASIYWSREALKEKLPERLNKIATRSRRSINFLVLDAIRQYVQAEERKPRRSA